MINYEEVYLAHHGIKGQRWGVRRFQNPDGSLTSAGAKRYAVDSDGNLVRKKGPTRSYNRRQIKAARNQGKLERVKAKEAAKTERYKAKLESKKHDPKAYVKTLSDQELQRANNRDNMERNYIKNHTRNSTAKKVGVAAAAIVTAWGSKKITKLANKSLDKVSDLIIDSVKDVKFNRDLRRM